MRNGKSHAVRSPAFNAGDAVLTRYLLARCKRNKEEAEKVAEQKILGEATVELWLDSQRGV